MSQATQTIKQKNKRLIGYILIGVVFMFGFAYMLVPLYNLVCKQIGLNGRSTTRDALDLNVQIDTSRTVLVKFTTNIPNNLAFIFTPLRTHIRVHPGETKTIWFHIKNQTGHRITIQAVPSIAPSDTAIYLKKTQCFCFTQQTFEKGDNYKVPVIFHIDPKLPKKFKYLTLQYTLYDATHYLKQEKQFRKGRIHLTYDHEKPMHTIEKIASHDTKSTYLSVNKTVVILASRTSNNRTILSLS